MSQTSATIPQARMNSAEVNLLIARYCEETGLAHTAKSITFEAGLTDIVPGTDKPLIDANLPRGQLIRILHRGLLYLEAEARWQGLEGAERSPRLLDDLPGPSSLPRKTIANGPSELPSPEERDSLSPELPPPKTSRKGESVKRKEKRSDSMDVDEPVASTSAQTLDEPSAAKKARIETSDLPSKGPPTPVAPPSSIRMPSPSMPNSKAPLPSPKFRAPAVVVKTVQKAAPPPRVPTKPLVAKERRSRSTSPVVTKQRKVSPTIEKKPKPAPKPSPAPRSAPVPKKEPKEDDGDETGEEEELAPGRGRNPDHIALEEQVIRLHCGSHNVQTCSWNATVPSLLATGGNDSVLRIYQIPLKRDMDVEEYHESATKKQALSTRHGSLAAVAWNPDGTLVAVGCEDGAARLWTPEVDLCAILALHNENVFAVKWSPSGSMILTGSQDQSIILWDLGSNRHKQQWKMHEGGILDLDWFDDESYFASCAGDNEVHLYQVGRSTPYRRLTGHTDEVNSIKFSPDRTMLASASDDKVVRVWSLAGMLGNPVVEKGRGKDGELLEIEKRHGCLKLRGHTAEVHSINWQPKQASKILASASFDHDIRIWDVETGQCKHVLARHTEYVYTLTWRPDGGLLATGSDDRRVCVWSVKDGRLVWEYEHQGPVYECAWHPSRPHVAVAGDGCVVLDLEHLADV